MVIPNDEGGELRKAAESLDKKLEALVKNIIGMEEG